MTSLIDRGQGSQDSPGRAACPRWLTMPRQQRRVAKRRRSWSRAVRALRPKRREMNVSSRKAKKAAWNWLKLTKNAWDSKASRYSRDPESLGMARSNHLCRTWMLRFNRAHLAICTATILCICLFIALNIRIFELICTVSCCCSANVTCSVSAWSAWLLRKVLSVAYYGYA